MVDSDASIVVKIRNMSGSKSNELNGHVDNLSFNVNAKLEEIERKEDEATIGFAINIVSKPAAVKVQVEGIAEIAGNNEQIRKILAPDPQMKIPIILNKLYQKIYPNVFLLTNILNVSSPSPSLLVLEKLNPGSIDGANSENDGQTQPLSESENQTNQAVKTT